MLLFNKYHMTLKRFIKLDNIKITRKFSDKNTMQGMYKSTEEIPKNLRELLPPHAQHIYMKSHNRALLQYQDPNTRRYGGTLTEVAHRVAWAAVKSKYYKDDREGIWKPLPGVNQDEYEEEYTEDPLAQYEEYKDK
jgi:cation transport regulator